MIKNWLDIVFVVVSVSLLEGAIKGTFYSYGRGGNRGLIATVKSVPVRLAISLIAIVLLTWAIWDYVQKTWEPFR